MIVREHDYGDLLDLTGHDPLARASAWRPHGRVWTGGESVAFVGMDSEIRIRSVIAFGPRPQIPRLLESIAAELPDGVGVTVPRGTPMTPPPRDAEDWDFRATARPPGNQPGEDVVRWLGPEDLSDVTDLLKIANPGSSARPGDPKVRRWAGVRDDTGRLLACLADTSRLDDVGHLSAVSVHPGARGLRLGPAVTAFATREMLDDGRDLVTLGLYASNDIARRMYDRLGFSDDHPLTSGDLDRPGSAHQPIG